MPEYTYKVITETEPLEIMYQTTVASGLMETFNPGYDPSLGDWLRVCGRDDTLVLGGYVDGELGGFLLGVPFAVAGPTLCMEIAVCSYRRFARHAAALSRGAYLWCFDHNDCASLIGRVIDTNRHVIRMAPSVGFSVMGRVPGLYWSRRRKEFRDGYIVIATRESVEAAIKAAEEG